MADDIIAYAKALDDLKTEVYKMRALLVGNGQPGLCEMMRINTANIASLTAAVAATSLSTAEVLKQHGAHLTWHAAPENYTLQEMLRHKGLLMFAVLIVGFLTLLGAVVAGGDVLAFVRGLIFK